MTVQREIRVSVLVLLVFQLATALGAIALFARMSPAIGEVLAANDVTLHAAEDMLAALAEQPSSKKAFDDALERTKTNVTEEAEPLVIEQIDVHAAAFFRNPSNAAARAELVGELKQLTEINRRSMQRANERAQALGIAGAWACVVLGLIGFAFFIVYARRLRRRISDPLQEIERVIDALHSGDTYRRCVASGPDEIQAIAFGLNGLLDQQTARELAAEAEVPADRTSLLYFLDQLDEPTLLVDQEGAVLAANEAGSEWLDAKAPADVKAFRETHPERVVAIGEKGPYRLTVG